MTVLVAGAAAVYDLICTARGGRALPGRSEVGALAACPGADGAWLPGGAAPTIALVLAAQGCAVALFHPLSAGSDSVRRRLGRAGIDLSRAPTADPARCVIMQTQDGRLAWSGAPDLSGMVVTDALLDGITHVVVASRWGAWTTALMHAAAARSIPCSLIGEAVPQVAAHRWHCVVLDDAQAASISALDALHAVTTRGAAGATAGRGLRHVLIPPVAIETVDTTGAGDVFGATFVARVLAGDEAPVAGDAAAAAAGRTCTGWGAWWGLDQPQAAASTEQIGRLRGALLGLACGDAFGMPNSFLRVPVWRDDMQPGPPDSPYHAGYPAGRITDDTEQALALTAALEDGFTPQAVAARLNEWFVAVGGAASLAVGPSTRRAMLAFQNGDDVATIGRTGVTNGAAMRVAPIAAFAALKGLDLERLVDQVEIACLPTHHTNPGIAGAAAIAAAVAAGVAGKSWAEVMADAEAGARLGASRGTWIYAPDIAARIVQARRIAGYCEDDAALIAAVSDVIGAGEPSVESVPAAVAVADYAGGDPERAIALAGNLRGDTDTVAAMAGAICGAYAGDAALPDAWGDLVQLTNGLNVAAWAERLLRCATASG